MFQQVPLQFRPGIYANRSKRSSEQRWVDGDLIRFRDDVPAQMGGWRALPVSGATIAGRPCGAIAWRPNSQSGRFMAIGTNSHAYLFDGSFLSDITPSDMTVGRTDSIEGVGYGAGPFGDDTYGTPRTISGITLVATSWTFDMFGETVLGVPTSDGLIREFTEGSDTLLTTVAEAPTCRALVVSPERHVFALGADDNPRLVQWSDREDYTVWDPLSTNRAGGYEMQVTSPFQCGARVRGLTCAWTESEMVVFEPSFNALVYSRQTVDESTGAVGPGAVAVIAEQAGASAFWFGIDGFYMFDGIVRKLNCELQDYVFNDINLTQRAKFTATTNIEFQEIRFSYCSAGSMEIDRCVVLCTRNGAWSKMNIERTVWVDRKIFRKPIALNASGTIYEHEVGETADGLAMQSFATSHPLTLGTGQSMMHIASFWPDLDPASDGAALTIIGKDYPGGPDIVFGPYSFAKSAEKVDLSVNVRQAQVKMSGNGGYWEMGLPMIDVQQSGGRG